MADYRIRSEKEGRACLADVVPIDTPFLFGIFVGDICNFRCRYCIQSAPDDSPEKSTLIKKFMDMKLFSKVVSQLEEFPQKIKKILLTSMGEPLLNPNIIDMLKMLNEHDIADEYEIVSNASMLSKEMSKRLIDAGLTRLCVSLQGITTEAYANVCGVALDCDELYENLEYFFKMSRGKCKLHIKTVDLALKGVDENSFLGKYGRICDTIHIDKVMPVFKGVDYTDVVLDMEKYTESEFVRCKNICCSPIFYTFYVLADGSIAPCCDHPQPTIYGNVNDITLVDAWNGEEREKFLMTHLEGKRWNNDICKKCVTPLNRKFESDILDGREKEIRNRILSR